MKKNNYGKILKDGIITQNPVLVQVLGMCPTLAVSTRLMNGLGMGAAVTAVLICSNLFISLLRKVIDKRIRIASFIVIIAGFVTMVEMLMKAFMPSLSESLGVYIPLIVVNCIILARAEAFASRNRPLPSVVDGLACGLGFTGAICIVSTIREVLGTGALLGYDFKLIPPIMIFGLAPGGLLVLGFVMAFCAWISKRRKAKAAPAGEAAAAPEEAKAEKPAEPEIRPAAKEPQLEKATVKPLITVVETKAAEAAEEIAPAEASPVQGEVSPQATEGLLTSDKPQPAEEAESADTELLKTEGDSSSASPPRNDSEPAAEPAPSVILSERSESKDLTPPSVILSPQGEGSPAESSREEETDTSSVTDAGASATPSPRGEGLPASDEITYASEEEREAALAEALRYFGGVDTETPAEASPVQGEVPPQAAEGLLTSETPAPAEAADSVIPDPQGEGSPADTGAPQTEGDSSSAPETPPRNDSVSRPEAKPAANTQLTFDTEEDGLEPPSFMTEPVTRPRDKKEGR
ncbi:MAG: electron transport complex subunit RsxE [Clostridia bacterium]|nr:electron transport complex subunit RsxE [Clostridia bacterium]